MGMERLCPVMALGVTVVDAAEKREAGWIYLDVRTEEEFVQEHVPGSVHVPVFVSDPQGGLVPNANFTAEVARLIPDAESPLLVGCRSGRRSKRRSNCSLRWRTRRATRCSMWMAAS